MIGSNQNLALDPREALGLGVGALVEVGVAVGVWVEVGVGVGVAVGVAVGVSEPGIIYKKPVLTAMLASPGLQALKVEL